MSNATNQTDIGSPTPSPSALCHDDASWRTKSGRTCNYIAEDPGRCWWRGIDHSKAFDSCPIACSTCSSPSTSPTLSKVPTTGSVCEDDLSWETRSGRSCKDVAYDPNRRCWWKGTDMTTATEGCPSTCATCDQPSMAPTSTGAPSAPLDCVDDSAWGTRAGKSCSDVAEDPDGRCWWTGTDGSVATSSCQAACSSCASPSVTPTVSKAPSPSTLCEDDSEWITPFGKSCHFVAGDPRRRCRWRGADRTVAYDGCPVACGVCATPTMAPTNGSAIDENDDTCKDDPTWRSGRTGKSCTWISRSRDPQRHCLIRDKDGVTAYEACPATCGC